MGEVVRAVQLDAVWVAAYATGLACSARDEAVCTSLLLLATRGDVPLLRAALDSVRAGWPSDAAQYEAGHLLASAAAVAQSTTRMTGRIGAVHPTHIPSLSGA